jgi:hypothetical protein
MAGAMHFLAIIEDILGSMKKPNWLWLKAIVATGVFLMFGAGPGLTQQMVLPTHEVPSPDVAAEALRGDEARIGWVKLGPFDIIPSFQSSVYYDDNVGAQEVNEEEAIVLTLAPTIDVVASDMADRMGKSLQVSYTPGFFFFFGDDVSDRNRINHSANISGQLAGAKLELGFDQAFRFTTGPVIDLGTSADRMFYDTRLTSRYNMSEKTSIDVNGMLRISNYSDEEFFDTLNLANDNWLNYNYSEKLRLGLGLIFGFTDIQDFEDQTFQQLRVRADYAIAEKVDLQASAGGEWRQFKSGIDDTLNPVWNLGAAYRPRDSTTFQLTLFQRYDASSRTGSQSYVNTGVTLSLRQMLMQRLALNLGGSYAVSDYESTVQGGQADRKDDLYGARVSLDFYLRPRWTVGVFYNYSVRDSTEPTLEFERNRVGLQTAWTY